MQKNQRLATADLALKDYWVEVVFRNRLVLALKSSAKMMAPRKLS
jgi:hypothetical protein